MEFGSLLDPFVLLSILMGILVFYSQYFEMPTSILKPLSGPMSWSILGNLPQLIAAGFDITTLHDRLFKVFGAVFSYRLFGRRVVVLGDDALIDQAFDHDDLCGAAGDGFREKLSKQDNVGILTSYGLTWKDNRDFLTRYLTENLTSERLEKLCGREGTKFAVTLNKHGAASKDVDDSLSLACTNIFVRILFGKDIDNDDDEGMKHLSGVLTKRRAAGEISGLRRLLPGFVARLPFSTGRRRWKLDTELIDVLTKLIEKHETQSSTEDECFLDAYLRAIQDQWEHPDDRMVNTINMTNLLWTCYDLLSFGVEYAPNILSCALSTINKQPAVKARCIADLKGDSEESGKVSVGRHAYVDAILLETRRLVASKDPLIISRVARADLSIGDDVEIPQGSIVVQYDHHPKTEFHPDRFVTADGALVKQANWMPFIEGKRSCPVEVMTISICYTMLCKLCRR